MTEEETKKGLVTNDSKLDLVHKKAEDLTPIENHKDAERQIGIKRTIKVFELDKNKLTGLKNFTEVRTDPLERPHYALPPG